MNIEKIELHDEETGNLRVRAALVDFFIIVVILFILPYERILQRERNIYIILLAFITIEFIYFVVMETFIGCTVGKWLFKLRVVDQYFDKPSILQSGIRALFWLFEVNPIMVFFPLIMYYVIQKKKTGQRIADMLANTYVLKLQYVNEFKNIPESSYEYRKKIDEINKKLPLYYTNLNTNLGFIRYKSALRIIGIENLTYEDLVEQINLGKRFVIYSYVIFIFFYLRGVSPIYFNQNSSKANIAKWKYTFISLLAFSFMIPSITVMMSTKSYIFIVGLLLLCLCIYIYCPRIINNLKGGIDITDEIMDYINMKRNSDYIIKDM